MAHRRLHGLATAEHALTERVHTAAAGALFYTEVPRLETEVNDLPSLFEVGRNLFGFPAEDMRSNAPS